MKCRTCHRRIAPGMEAAKRVEYWVQPDTSVKVFSDSVAGLDGKLSEAAGMLESAQHSKCYWTERKRVERGGDAVLGTHPDLQARIGADPGQQFDDQEVLTSGTDSNRDH